MPVTATVHFRQPQQQIAKLLRERLDKCLAAKIVTGFATIEGCDALFPALAGNVSKLATLVVGAGTYRAFGLLDGLLAAGLPGDRLRIHLGHSRMTGARAKHPFYRYHPMLHSKVYFMQMPNGLASAFIGSHNMTGFAMYGLNGEAGVMLEGSTDSTQMRDIQAHVDEAVRQSVVYLPTMKDAYAWWSVQFLEGLRDKANDAPRDGEAKATIVVVSVRAEDPLPQKDDVIYFEIPAALGQIHSLRAEVHVYLFRARPESTQGALARLRHAHSTLCLGGHLKSGH